MKQAKRVLLVMMLALAPGALARGGGATLAAPVDESAARALAVYEQGKRLYDAKDYAGALARFDEAAAIEPTHARWQYNRGLALRKLGRSSEAREALLRSRALEPDYKRAEIDDKLRELGPEPEPPARAEVGGMRQGPAGPPSDHPPMWILLLFIFSTFAGLVLFFRFLSKQTGKVQADAGDFARARKAEARARNSLQNRPPDPRPRPWNAELEGVAASLTKVEHALRLNEDSDLRALLNQATQAEQQAWRLVESESGPVVANSPSRRRIEEARVAAERALRHASAAHGEQAFLPEGERVGCYFCARPLANPSFRMRVPLKRGTQTTDVLACPPCANRVGAGQPPPVKVVRSADGRLLHWSEVPQYDPYVHAHRLYPGESTLPAWQYTPERSLSDVAALAAGGVGGAVAAGLAAYGVSRLLDLDGEREAAAAQAATEAAARRASESREAAENSGRDWKDHS